MIFVVETQTRCLLVHIDEAIAVREYEGVDVEAVQYLFWSNDGTPLEAEFSVPNKRGWFSVQSGTYHLVPASKDHHADLIEALDEVAYLESNPHFKSLAEIRSYIGRTPAGT